MGAQYFVWGNEYLVGPIEQLRGARFERDAGDDERISPTRCFPRIEIDADGG